MATPFSMRMLSGGGNSAQTWSPIYGGAPQLRSANSLQGDVSNVINSAIPGFSGLAGGASDYLRQLMSGELSTGTQNAIRDAGATFGVQSGMPGSGLARNRTLRDIGTTSERQQQQGLQGLISLLSGVSGTAALTPGQIGEQANAQSQYASAPNPTAAGMHAEDLFNRQFSMANRPTGGGGGGASDPYTPWWAQGKGYSGSITRTPSFGLGNKTTQWF